MATQRAFSIRQTQAVERNADFSQQIIALLAEQQEQLNRIERALNAGPKSARTRKMKAVIVAAVKAAGDGSDAHQ